MNGQTIITSFNALRLKGKIDYDNQIFSETLFIIPYLQEECQSQWSIRRTNWIHSECIITNKFFNFNLFSRTKFIHD